MFFYTMEKLILALLLRKKVYVVNAGIGEPCTAYGRAILRRVLARCNRIIVRDLQSQQICKDLGIGSVFAPDIVLSLPEILAQRSVRSPESPLAKPFVTVCLRHNPNTFGRYEMNDARIHALARALDDLIEHHGVDIVFLPFQENPANHKGDKQFHAALAQRMAHRDRTQVREWTADLDEVCRWIGSSQMVITMRLHAAVLAQACGRPSVLMPCDRKIIEFGKLMNLRHTIEASTLDEVSQVNAVLESAWAEAHSQHFHREADSATQVAALWASLRLEEA